MTHRTAPDGADVDPEQLVGRPLQARGRHQVRRILAAARRVLEARGHGATTTNHVASEAGISPGSLYQYFDNLDAILDGVAAQYLMEYEAVAASIPNLSSDAELDDTVDNVVDPLLAFNLANPSLSRLLADSAAAGRLASSHARLNARIRAHLNDALRAALPDEADADVVVDMSTAIFKATLPHVLDTDGDEREAWITELKRALRAYLAAQPRTGA